MSTVLIEVHEGWAEIVFNRPETRNAIDGELAQALAAALDSVEKDASVRAVVLRGAGNAFCSGLDLKALARRREQGGGDDFAALWDDVHTRLLESRKALIVALERYAINGGAALALAGDFLVCGEGAFLQIGEVRLGMAAPRNLMWLALRHSEAVAARLALLGERVGAPELYRLGIATELVADHQVVERAQEMARQIAGYPPEGVVAVKSGLRAAAARMPPAQWLAACAPTGE